MNSKLLNQKFTLVSVINILKFYFINKFLAILIFAVIMLILMTIYPIAMIVIGAKNMDKCPIEPKIPIWLIVSGSLSIVVAIFSLITIAVPSKT